jgi:hypothetical protein
MRCVASTKAIGDRGDERNWGKQEGPTYITLAVNYAAASFFFAFTISVRDPVECRWR